MDSWRINIDNSFLPTDLSRQKIPTVFDFNSLWDDVNNLENCVGDTDYPEITDRINNLIARANDLEYRISKIETYTPAFILDKGMGNNIVCTGEAISSSTYDTLAPGYSIYSRVCFDDLCKNVHYTGSNELTFYIKRGSITSSSANPRNAYLTLNCGDLGVNEIELWVSDGVITGEKLIIYFRIDDRKNYC